MAENRLTTILFQLFVGFNFLHCTVSLLIFFKYASRPCDFQRYRSTKNRWYFLLDDILLIVHYSHCSIFVILLAPNSRSKEFSRAWILPVLPTCQIHHLSYSVMEPWDFGTDPDADPDPRILCLMDPDADPGGPNTYGSGSGTLVKSH